MKVYLAGPDVFRQDALQWAEAARALCAARGLTALVPLDGEDVTAAGIYASNVAMIRAADAVVANLNPFRGAEPDSGTCFEVGFAAALGKPIVGYVAEAGELVERVRRHGGVLQQDASGWHDAAGMRVENFGLPLNLMLAMPARVVVGGLDEALAQLGAARGEAQ